jgi:hypothetical protein
MAAAAELERILDVEVDLMTSGPAGSGVTDVLRDAIAL